MKGHTAKRKSTNYIFETFEDTNPQILS